MFVDYIILSFFHVLTDKRFHFNTANKLKSFSLDFARTETRLKKSTLNGLEEYFKIHWLLQIMQFQGEVL